MSLVADTATLPRHLGSNPVLSRWVRVCADGVVEVRVGKVEFGQGILTAVAQVVADELDVAVDMIRMLPANTRTGPDQGLTAGSMSVFDTVPALGMVCANVRALFVAEAARRSGVDPGQVTIDGGSIRVPGSAPMSYGGLAGSVDLDVPADRAHPPKNIHDLLVSGASVERLDLPAKIAGRPVFIHDLRLPGLLYGRVVRPPSPDARLLDADESGVTGVGVRVVRDGSFLAVIGASEAEVSVAVERLRATTTWQEQSSLPDEAQLDTFLRSGPHETIPVLDEDVAATQGRRLRATYSRGFLAHASIAPSCGLARWEPDGTLSVWSHSQGITKLRDAIAQALDIAASTITVEHVQSAGCYGHNPADDAAYDAVLLARTVPGRPVQVQWSRRDELTWGPFGSAMTADLEAVLDESGRVRSWDHQVWSQGHTSRPGYAGVPGLLAGAHVEAPLSYPAPADPPLRAGGGTVRNAVPIYDVGNRRVTGHRLLNAPIRSSALRALGSHLNVFAIESFMDELAEEADQDPLAFRLAHLRDDRARAVLERAATTAGWGERLPDGCGRGIGFARYKDKGAYCAVVAEVEAEHEIRVRRLTIAVDVGRIVNPDGVRNQIEGGATQATSWTLKERVRFDRTRITSDDWESYPILRFSEVPEIRVDLFSRPELTPVGAGEAAMGPTAGALGNAVTAAVGVRVRTLPITTEAVVAAIEEQHP